MNWWAELSETIGIQDSPVRFSHGCQWLGQARIHAVETRIDGQTTGRRRRCCRCCRRADTVHRFGCSSLVTQLLLPPPFSSSIAEPHLHKNSQFVKTDHYSNLTDRQFTILNYVCANLFDYFPKTFLFRTQNITYCCQLINSIVSCKQIGLLIVSLGSLLFLKNSSIHFSTTSLFHLFFSFLSFFPSFFRFFFSFLANGNFCFFENW